MAETAPDYRVVVLASGRGSNLQALIEHQETDRFTICSVLSDNPQASARHLAVNANIPFVTIDWRNRTDAEKKLQRQLQQLKPDLVVLAGFMRILSADTVTTWHGRMINIHPSLLPLYPGLHTHRRVLADDRTVHGASVHFVTAELDGGPIISQTLIDVLPGDTPESLARRLLPREHKLLVNTVRWLRLGRVQLADSFIMYNGAPLEKPLIVS